MANSNRTVARAAPDRTSRRPRIAIFVPNLEGGGAERVMVTLANGFSERGFAVDLVLVEKTGPFLELVSEDVRIVDLRAGRMATALPRLVSYLRTERPEALLSALSHANIVSAIAKRFARPGLRVVLSERVSYVAYARCERGFANALIRLLMRWVYPFADVVVTVAEAMVDELYENLGIPRDRLYAIANPIVGDDLRAPSLGEPGFWPAVPLGHRVILGAGRLSEQKDFGCLIEAFDEVRRHLDVVLVIIGEGELRGDLEALIALRNLQDRVYLPGFISPPFPLMRRADLFVLSSRYEGLPGTLIQAMACGTAVVSTDCPTGPSQILDGGRWGELVPVGDAAALAAAMMRALEAREHPDVARRAGDFGVGKAISEYLRVLLPDADAGADRAGA